MRRLRMIFDEFYGLFVDDVGLAVAIVIWLAIVGFGLPYLGVAAAAGGPILFLGLALILLERTMRHRL